MKSGDVIDEDDDFNKEGHVVVIGEVIKETPKALLLSCFGNDGEYNIRGVWIPKLSMVAPMTLQNKVRSRLVIFRLPRYTAITKGLAHYEIINQKEVVRLAEGKFERKGKR